MLMTEITIEDLHSYKPFLHLLSLPVPFLMHGAISGLLDQMRITHKIHDFLRRC